MSMTISQINAWAQERLKGTSGAWDNDVLCCIFYAMEECGPCYGTWDRNPTVSKNYVRLVEIACAYLRDVHNFSELRRFCDHIFNYGISYLSEARKKRFAEQTAWMLNLPEYADMLKEFLAPLHAQMPDTATLALDWQDARVQYKRRNTEAMPDVVFD